MNKNDQAFPSSYKVHQDRGHILVDMITEGGISKLELFTLAYILNREQYPISSALTMLDKIERVAKSIEKKAAE